MTEVRKAHITRNRRGGGMIIIGGEESDSIKEYTQYFVDEIIDNLPPSELRSKLTDWVLTIKAQGDIPWTDKDQRAYELILSILEIGGAE